MITRKFGSPVLMVLGVLQVVFGVGVSFWVTSKQSNLRIRELRISLRHFEMQLLYPALD